MLREFTVDTGATTLNAVALGDDGPPLVMLHGVTGRWQHWLSVMPAFAPRWRLFALDHRGHGRSGRVAGGYRIVDYAADVIAFLRAGVGEPAVVMGHSLGAIIGIAVAADAPELVRALVLEDPPLGAFSDQRFDERTERPRFLRLRELARSGAPARDLLPALAEIQPTSDPAALLARATALTQLDPDVLTLILEDRAKEGYDLERRLARITSPTLLLQGEPALGGALEDERAARAMALLPNGLHVRMPGVGHGLHADAPLAFCRIVHDFLESL
ncbi:MAG: alpha/beta hydrolase [Chloroflexi bacterium]|nr:alpha/beta hydrolase [Chloroflexota bacterium]